MSYTSRFNKMKDAVSDFYAATRAMDGFARRLNNVKSELNAFPSFHGIRNNIGTRASSVRTISRSAENAGRQMDESRIEYLLGEQRAYQLISGDKSFNIGDGAVTGVRNSRTSRVGVAVSRSASEVSSPWDIHREGQPNLPNCLVDYRNDRLQRLEEQKAARNETSWRQNLRNVSNIAFGALTVVSAVSIAAIPVVGPVIGGALAVYGGSRVGDGIRGLATGTEQNSLREIADHVPGGEVAYNVVRIGSCITGPDALIKCYVDWKIDGWLQDPADSGATAVVPVQVGLPNHR